MTYYAQNRIHESISTTCIRCKVNFVAYLNGYSLLATSLWKGRWSMVFLLKIGWRSKHDICVLLTSLLREIVNEQTWVKSIYMHIQLIMRLSIDWVQRAPNQTWRCYWNFVHSFFSIEINKWSTGMKTGCWSAAI